MEYVGGAEEVEWTVTGKGATPKSSRSSAVNSLKVSEARTFPSVLLVVLVDVMTEVFVAELVDVVGLIVVMVVVVLVAVDVASLEIVAVSPVVP